MNNYIGPLSCTLFCKLQKVMDEMTVLQRMECLINMTKLMPTPEKK